MGKKMIIKSMEIKKNCANKNFVEFSKILLTMNTKNISKLKNENEILKKLTVQFLISV